MEGDVPEAVLSPGPFPPKGRRRRVLAVFLALVGFILVLGGAYLAILGGSFAYLVAGGALLVTGFWCWIGAEHRAIVAYQTLLVATIVWSLWEVGADLWALMPRLAAPLLLSVWVAWPWIRRFWVRNRLVNTGRRVAVAAVVVALGLFGLQFVLLSLAGDEVHSATESSVLGDTTPSVTDWRHYGGSQGGQRFSQLSQINPRNVSSLEVAWSYHTGLSPQGIDSSLEVTPLMVGDTLYICTGYNDVIALDAETGRQRWRFEADVDSKGVLTATCRGVAYFAQDGATGLCAARIITNTIDARLIALDAATGQLCSGFGKDGIVDLTVGMGDIPNGFYFVTSAPTLIRGKVVLGGWVSDNQYWGEPSGVVRAFDAVTGELAWAWDMGQPDRLGAPPEGETYTRSTPNAWAPMSADEELGLVYVPTGNATPDYYGAQRRPFDDEYSSSVVALGRAIWEASLVFPDRAS